MDVMSPQWDPMTDTGLIDTVRLKIGRYLALQTHARLSQATVDLRQLVYEVGRDPAQLADAWVTHLDYVRSVIEPKIGVGWAHKEIHQVTARLGVYIYHN